MRILTILLVVLGQMVCGFGAGLGAAEWAETAKLREARDSHTATLLLSGKIPVTGGYSAGVE